MVNNVQPGPIDTDVNPEWGLRRNAESGHRAPPLGKPGEVATRVAFLASPVAAYITGTTLNADGGFNG